MRLLRPALQCVFRSGRRLQAGPRVVPRARAFSARGVVITPQVKVGSIVDVGSMPRRRQPTLSPCLTHAPKDGPLQAYAELVLQGKIQEDRHQVKTLYLLQKVRISLRIVSPILRALQRIDSAISQCRDGCADAQCCALLSTLFHELRNVFM